MVERAVTVDVLQCFLPEHCCVPQQNGDDLRFGKSRRSACPRLLSGHEVVYPTVQIDDMIHIRKEHGSQWLGWYPSIVPCSFCVSGALLCGHGISLLTVSCLAQMGSVLLPPKKTSAIGALSANPPFTGPFRGLKTKRVGLHLFWSAVERAFFSLCFRIEFRAETPFRIWIPNTWRSFRRSTRAKHAICPPFILEMNRIFGPSRTRLAALPKLARAAIPIRVQQARGRLACMASVLS